MSEQKWTKEPWEVRTWLGPEWPNQRASIGNEVRAIATSPRYVSVAQSAIDFERAVTCVNALQGIDHPAAVREVIAAARDMDEWARQHGVCASAKWLRLQETLAALNEKEQDR